MDMIFDYLERDINVLLALLGLSSAIAVAALWKVVADLLRKPDTKASEASPSEAAADRDGTSHPLP